MPTTPLRVAIIQPNIDNKWSVETVPEIRRTLHDLTDLAIAAHPPDLVVWPETALPDEIRYSESSVQLVRHLAGKGSPILLGSIDYIVEPLPAGPTFLNGSFLFGTNGQMVAEYHKRHLVMFGEYIPFSRWLPFLRTLTPFESEFTPGARVTRFEVAGVPFGVLICFEDLMPNLARDVARTGARFMVNQTNDGWFDPWWGSRAHVDNALFRCVETRLPMVRACNTGMSCVIDASGRVRNVLRDPETGSLRISGFRNTSVACPDRPVTTPFQRWPHAFAICCGLLAMASAATRSTWT